MKDKLTEQDIGDICKLRISGMEATDIAKKYNIVRSAVIYWCKKYNISTSESTPTVLSNEQIQQVRKLKSIGKSNQQIADSLKTKMSTIRYYVAKHNIPGPTKEQLSAILLQYTKEQEQQVLSLKPQMTYAICAFRS